MAILKYKASIPGSKIFMREYEVREDMTLYDLHEYLVDDLDFAPDQMVIFRGLDAAGNIKSEYGLFDMGDGSMDSVTLSYALKKGEETIQYVFDIRKDRFIILTFIGTSEEHPRAHYPRLTAEKGRNPDQFAKGYEDLDQFAEFSDESTDDSVIEEDELPEGEEYL